MRAALAGLVVALFVGAIALYGWLRGWHVTELAAGELAALLRPNIEVFRPDGSGPFPTVVQFHGCGGVYDNQREWARAFVEVGWAGIVIDSNTPRGLTGASVCSGRALHGSERAGDVLVSLAHARALPFVDASRIVLAGWSHGGWSIMDLLAMDPPAELPTNLSVMPAGGLRGVAGLLFVYPYCGLGTRSEPWTRPVPALFVMAEADSVAPPQACTDFATTLRERGHPVEVETLEGVDHAFDEQHRAGSRLAYDGVATAEAHRLATGFLERLAGQAFH